MHASHVVPVSMSVLLKRSAKVKSTKLMLNSAPIVDHVPKYVLLMLLHLSNKTKRFKNDLLDSSRFFFAFFHISSSEILNLRYFFYLYHVNALTYSLSLIHISEP